MMEQRYGKIVNISSVQGIGAGADGSANYASAKAGMVGLTKRTAREAGPHAINVNCVVPGLIVTPLTYEQEVLAGRLAYPRPFGGNQPPDPCRNLYQTAG